MPEIKAKKMFKNLVLLVLTGGASLTLGLLSFGGIYALTPFIPLAVAAFGLATVYEAEIYFQNIGHSIKKLTSYQHLQRQMVRQWLLEKALNNLNATEGFLGDYLKQLRIVQAYADKTLSKEDKEKQRQAQKTLSHMEKWFADLIFSELRTFSDYEASAYTLFDQEEELTTFKSKVARHRWYYVIIAVLVCFSGIFSTLGTAFLLADVIPLLPFIAGLSPAILMPIVVTASLFAGAAYAGLVFNAVTDIITNKTIQKFFGNVKKTWQDDWRKGVLMGVATAVLAALALTLTVFTAGTWWTIVKNAKPMMDWFKVKAHVVFKVFAAMPAVVMGVLHPVVMGFSALAFNLENSSESMESIINLGKGIKHFFKEFGKQSREQWQKLRAKENWLQILNPARLLTKIIVAPARIGLFLGHLVSIGVTADRVPYVPNIVSALIGTICEGFEDLHYFVGHSHHHHHDENPAKIAIEERQEGAHGHNHDNDLPTKLINLVVGVTTKPIAALWDWVASKVNSGDKKSLSLVEAFKKTYQIKDAETITEPEGNKSPEWDKAHACYHIDKFSRKHFGSYYPVHDTLGHKTGKGQKRDALENMAKTIRSTEATAAEALAACKSSDDFTKLKHYRKSWFIGKDKPTKSQEFVDETLGRLVPGAAPGG